MNQKNGILIFLALTFLHPLIFAQDLKKQTVDMSTRDMKSQNAIIANLFSEEVSKTLPQKIDQYTQLITVKAEENNVIYTFEINTGVKSDASVQNEDRSRMNDAVTQGVCQSSKRFLDADINISYLYVSAKTKVKLFRFDITKERCLVKAISAST